MLGVTSSWTKDILLAQHRLGLGLLTCLCRADLSTCHPYFGVTGILTSLTVILPIPGPHPRPNCVEPWRLSLGRNIVESVHEEQYDQGNLKNERV